jgi:release factor glutamine methyltransferase
MRPSEVLARATRYLERHGVPSARANAEVLLMHVLGTDRSGLYARAEGLDAREARMFGRALCQRCAGTPLQHLTGEQAFRRIVLEVRLGVFVPRPETEVLVDVALRALRNVDAPVVVDVGAGSGAVALAVKDERPDAVLATDLAGVGWCVRTPLDSASPLRRSRATSSSRSCRAPRLGRLVISNPPYAGYADRPSSAAEPASLSEDRGGG